MTVLRSSSSSVVVCLVAVAVSACGDEPSVSAPSSPHANVVAGQQRRAAHPNDDMAREIPGFGGAYVDRSGALVLYVKDSAGAAAVRAAGHRALARRGRRDLGNIRLRLGRYDFDELGSWRLALRDLLLLPGVVGSGIDEQRNRILVRVSTPAARDVAEKEIDRLAVPREAVVVEITPPVSLTATLNNRIRPLKGGIVTVAKPSNSPYSEVCSLGAIVLNQNNHTQYLLTASHCTQDAASVGLGGNYSAVMYQPTDTLVLRASDQIATEYYDPPFVSSLPGCPSGNTCRYSDAALMSFNPASVLRDFGAVARPLGGPVFGVNAAGTNVIACDTCVVRYEADASYFLQGDTVYKIGRVTGWTGGTVGSTCFDIPTGHNNTVLCSVGVFGTARQGDSGAPLFTRVAACCGSSQGFYAFAGIVFASDNYEQLYASNRFYIYQELLNPGGYGDLIAHQ